MILNVGIDHHGLKVYKVYIYMITLVWPWFILQQGQILSKLLIVLQTNSQVSVNWTVGPPILHKISIHQ